MVEGGGVAFSDLIASSPSVFFAKPRVFPFFLQFPFVLPPAGSGGGLFLPRRKKGKRETKETRLIDTEAEVQSSKKKNVQKSRSFLYILNLGLFLPIFRQSIG